LPNIIKGISGHPAESLETVHDNLKLIKNLTKKPTIGGVVQYFEDENIRKSKEVLEEMVKVDKMGFDILDVKDVVSFFNSSFYRTANAKFKVLEKELNKEKDYLNIQSYNTKKELDLAINLHDLLPNNKIQKIEEYKDNYCSNIKIIKKDASVSALNKPTLQDLKDLYSLTQLLLSFKKYNDKLTTLTAGKEAEMIVEINRCLNEQSDFMTLKAMKLAQEEFVKSKTKTKINFLFIIWKLQNL
jgi:hypothetical protein